MSRIIMDTVIRRVRAGEHRAMGRQSDGNRGDSIFEQNAFRGDGIDIGRGFRLVAVTAKIVGATSINADEDDLAHACRGHRGAPKQPCSGRQDQGQCRDS